MPDQAITSLEGPGPETMKGKRDLALLAILVEAVCDGTRPLT
jgi:hypothetical protein